MELAGTLLLAPVAGTERRLATLRVGCTTTTDACNVAGKPLANGISLQLEDDRGTKTFVVDEIRSDSSYLSDVTVRFLALPEVAALAKAGDVDRPAGAGPMRGAVIVSVEGARAATGSVNMNVGVSASDVSINMGSQMAQTLSARDASLRVPVEATPNGWKYRGGLIRPGGVVTFETPTYAIRGLILSMTSPVTVGARH